MHDVHLSLLMIPDFEMTHETYRRRPIPGMRWFHQWKVFFPQRHGSMKHPVVAVVALFANASPGLMVHTDTGSTCRWCESKMVSPRAASYAGVATADRGHRLPTYVS